MANTVLDSRATLKGQVELAELEGFCDLLFVTASGVAATHNDRLFQIVRDVSIFEWCEGWFPRFKEKQDAAHQCEQRTCSSHPYSEISIQHNHLSLALKEWMHVKSSKPRCTSRTLPCAECRSRNER
jgi:hypothetical protein